MPAARYAFALLATGEICQKREGFISYRTRAKRQYIEFVRLGFPEAKHELWGFAAEREHIEWAKPTYRQKKKQEQE